MCNTKELFLGKCIYFLILSSIMFMFVFSLFNLEFFGILISVILITFSQLQGLKFYFEVNEMNFFFIFLTFWLIYFLMNCSKNFYKGGYLIFWLIFTFCFLTSNIWSFFIFFEISLIPTYFLVIGGSTPERVLAGNYLILYTFMGSLPLLLKMVYFSFKKSSLFFYFFSLMKSFFYFFILAFLIKLPIFLFHLWLPKAHVEASTEGSMLLAGILLKLGSYGLILFCSHLIFKIYLVLWVLLGGMIAGFFSLSQVDLKGLMAYSSIVHMSYMVFSSFNYVFLGVLGVIFMSVGHGFISAAMFYILSMAYKYTGSRKVYFLNSVLKIFYFSFFFCGVCLILNSSAPLSMKFLGEIYMFLHGSIVLGVWNFFLVLFLKFLGGFISILFFLLLFHGKKENKSFNISFCQISILFFLSFFSFIFFLLLKNFCK